MVKKNSFLSNMFGEGAKQKKMIKKIKSLKKEYEKLNSKLLSGKISQKELDKYYGVMEEIKKMSKKFTVKDGKIMLDNSQQVPVQPQQVPVQPQQVPVQPQQVPAGMPQPQAPEQPSPVMDERIKMIAEEEARAKEAYVRHQQRLQQQEAMRAEQIKQHMAEYQAQNVNNQLESTFEYANQPAQQPQQTPPTYLAIINVAEMPELKIKLEIDQVAGFKEAIETAMVTGAVFPYMNAVISGSKIVMYRIVLME